MWLRTEIELVVSGKGREVELGSVLPEGWKLAAISSQIPVAVDNSGHLKAQVRSGKWTVLLDAFRLDNPSELRYASEAKPAVTSQLVAFQSRPDFRMVEILGVPSVDVSQTTFPERWRSLPVYRWDTATPLRIEERLRGMGAQKPEGLRIARALWLDEDGRGMTFRDQLSGRMQQIWRLDAAPGQELGAVRNSGGQWQLITRNPQDGALGIEVRERNFNLEAAGRIRQTKTLSATGWRSDADTLNVDLNLPPGWRLFALFGADRLRGDWLTSWTLLDLFLVLVLSFAVFRLWGLPAALLAFVAFGLSYHEPGAPRYIWLFLLMPIALLRVVSSGWGRRVIITWKWLTIACLVVILTPFVAGQLQQALYPQLERVGSKGPFLARDFRLGGTGTVAPAPAEAARAKSYDASAQAADLAMSKAAPDSNLMYQANARIQTGPAVPDWSWRSVSFGWNGPVQASQRVHVLLIPPALERGLTILRVVLLLALAGVSSWGAAPGWVDLRQTRQTCRRAARRIPGRSGVARARRHPRSRNAGNASTAPPRDVRRVPHRCGYPLCFLENRRPAGDDRAPRFTPRSKSRFRCLGVWLLGPLSRSSLITSRTPPCGARTTIFGSFYPREFMTSASRGCSRMSMNGNGLFS